MAPASVNSETCGAPAVDPSSMPPMENVTVSPDRYLKAPAALVVPDRVGVRQETPWILPAWNTPVDSVGGGGVEDPLPPPPPHEASRMLNAETTRPFTMCILLLCMARG